METIDEQRIIDRATQLLDGLKMRDAFAILKRIPEKEGAGQVADILRASALCYKGSYKLSLHYALKFLEGLNGHDELNNIVALSVRMMKRKHVTGSLCDFSLNDSVKSAFANHSLESKADLHSIFVIQPNGICLTQSGEIIAESSTSTDFWEAATMAITFSLNIDEAKSIPGLSAVCWDSPNETAESWCMRHELKLKDQGLDNLVVPVAFQTTAAQLAGRRKIISVDLSENLLLDTCRFYQEKP